MCALFFVKNYIQVGHVQYATIKTTLLFNFHLVCEINQSLRFTQWIIPYIDLRQLTTIQAIRRIMFLNEL